MTCPVLDEHAVRAIATPALALAAVETAFRAMAEGTARNFPVVREVIAPGAVYGVKSGLMTGLNLVGLKTAGYWAANRERGEEPHQATIVLIDPRTGLRRGVVAANAITSLRTAAAAALSIRLLARPEARVLGILGAGVQGPALIEAARQVAAFDEILIGSRSVENARSLAKRFSQQGLNVRAAAPREVLAMADVIITATTATAPLFSSDALRPGVHIAAMGSDTAGKRELPADISAHARMFGDDLAQNLVLGEGQDLDAGAYVSTLGNVLTGQIPGRIGAKDITVFDSTGMAVQDIALAGAVLSLSGQISESSAGAATFD